MEREMVKIPTSPCSSKAVRASDLSHLLLPFDKGQSPDETLRSSYFRLTGAVGRRYDSSSACRPACSNTGIAPSLWLGGN